MLTSYSRMLPELLRHSDRQDVYDKLPDHLKLAHKPRDVERDDAPLTMPEAEAGLPGLGPLRPQLSALWDEGGEQNDEATEALALFASGDALEDSLDSDLALLEGAGF